MTPLAPRPCAPPVDFDPRRDLPPGFLDFYLPLHRELSGTRRELIATRAAVLAEAHEGQYPQWKSPGEAGDPGWRVSLPDWCQDQRNQMTGPADDAELVVKMLNSGAPGVMLDLEDSMANRWDCVVRGHDHLVAALHGELTYRDRKRGREVGIEASGVVTWNRVRGLHLGQLGILPDGQETPASLFDLALLAFRVTPEKLRHPLCIYIPKSESAAEGRWWREAFQAVARALGWPHTAIRCMALVESHPMAYCMEAFAWELRDHLVGLNLGRWDYMASLLHFTLPDPGWVLPDRNTIPHDVPFFQRVRHRLVDTCHRRGLLAIGGMTALFPSREDAALNARALEGLAQDKRNESDCGMDGAWTGHPDQNAVAVLQFPFPNQLDRLPTPGELSWELRPSPVGVGLRTVAGSRAAVRTVLRYRSGVLGGRGASLLDGYMEDLATDRIYRLMLAQRVRHGLTASVLGDDGQPVRHDPAYLSKLFDEELARLLEERARVAASMVIGTEDTLREARRWSEAAILQGWFDPV